MNFNEQASEKIQLHLLLSRISHEIRNPVTLLNSQIQLIEAHHPELQGSNDWEELQENLKYLLNLLQDLSDFNNADLLHLEEQNLRDFLLPIVASAKPTLDYLNISLELRFAEELPRILMDVQKLRQVILNLLRNAMEAITPPGNICIEAFLREETFFLRIQDTGSGIPAEYLSTLFEPFVTHKSGGSGLGLAISHQIVTAHHGTLQVTDTSEKGTTFTLMLPISSQHVSFDDTARV